MAFQGYADQPYPVGLIQSLFGESKFSNGINNVLFNAHLKWRFQINLLFGRGGGRGSLEIMTV